MPSFTSVKTLTSVIGLTITGEDGDDTFNGTRALLQLLVQSNAYQATLPAGTIQLRLIKGTLNLNKY